MNAPARRAALLVLLVAVAGAVGWFALRSRPSSTGPAAVFDDVRDRVLEGDGEALWRRLMPRAREEYVRFLEKMKEEANPMAVEWRRKTGISRADLAAQPPEKVMAREYLAAAESRLRGAKVFRQEILSPDEVLLYISLRDGTVHWVVRKVDGGWKVDNLLPLITADGWYNRAGEEPRLVRTGGLR